MSADSKIEWTDASWNPTRGCTKVSPGCKHCYAEKFAERFRGVPGHPYEQGFDLRIVPEKLMEPFKWIKPKKIFVNSMSDLFHPDITDEFLAVVFEVMKLVDWHVYQVLTKRPKRMRDLLNGKFQELAQLDHIWWGVSVEDRQFGVPRINVLRDTNVRHRFLSIEPLLEDLGIIDLSKIEWVIVGGESGPGARPMQASWARSIRFQCQERGIPFFYKQTGGVFKKRTGRLLDGKTHDELPKFSRADVPDRRARRRLMQDFEAKFQHICEARLIL